MVEVKNLKVWTEELIRWAEINSGSKHPAGLAKMLEVLKDAFAVLGGELEEIPLGGSGNALRIRKRVDADSRVFLCGHYDTVYHEDHPFQVTEMIDDETLRGPGVADMKGGLLILLKALVVFEQSAEAENLGWEVLLVPDEEIGSLNSRHLLDEAAKRYDLGLIFEPSLPDGAIVSGRKGSISGTVTAKGKGAHSGREFHEGRNAVTAIGNIALELEKLTNESITANIGYIEGGGAVNIVPDSAMCRVNIRMKHPEEIDQILATIEEVVKQVSKKREVELEWKVDTLRPPKIFDERTEKLFIALKDCAKELGQELHWKESGGCCDGNNLAAAGLPTIDTLGVIGGNIHTEDEYVDLTSIPERVELVSRFLEQIASGKVEVKS